MKILLCGTLLLTVLALPHRGAATVGPPFLVSQAGEPTFAAPGQQLSTSLKIEAISTGIRVTNLTITGDFTVDDISAPAEILLDPGESHLVTFAGTLGATYDPNDPLYASFDLQVGQNPAVEAVDWPLSYSYEDYLRAQGQRGIVYLGQEGGEVTGKLTRGGTITVKGRLVYSDPDGSDVGADNCTVEIRDDDRLLPSTTILTTATDENGFFNTNFLWRGLGAPDLRVVFILKNSNVNVENAWGTTYTVKTETKWNFGGSTWDLGNFRPAEPADEGPLHVLNTVTRLGRWLDGNGYRPLIRPNVLTPSPFSVAFTIVDDDGLYPAKILLPTAAQQSEPTMIHEYGHYWLSVFAWTTPLPDYRNGICDDTGFFLTVGHCLWCEEREDVALIEGFGDWLGDVAMDEIANSIGISTWGHSSFEDVECRDSLGAPCLCDPERTEGYVAALLRDISDSDGSPGCISCSTDRDGVCSDAAEILDAMASAKPHSAQDLLDEVKSRVDSRRLWSLANELGFSVVDDVPPPAPALGTNPSTSHAIGTPSPRSTIEFQLSISGDDFSGVDAMSVLLDPDPSAVPNTTVDVDISDVVGGTTSDCGLTVTHLPYSVGPLNAPVLTDYYLHVRARDQAGNWSTTWSTVGPYTIRPPTPADLTPVGTPAAWQYPVVPANDPLAFPGVAVVPSILDPTTAFVNLNVKNAGETAASDDFFIALHVDGETKLSLPILGGLDALSFHTEIDLNLGIRGGVHTFVSEMDSNFEIPENSESNNRWAHQFVYVPQELTAILNLGAPPHEAGGWEDLPSVPPPRFNGDARRVSILTNWVGVYADAAEADVSYRMRLYHSPTIGADDPDVLRDVRASSDRTGGLINAVFVQGASPTTVSFWDVAVSRQGDESSPYQIRRTERFAVVPDEPFGIVLDSNNELVLCEVDVVAAARVSMQLQATDPSAIFHAAWIDASLEAVALSDLSVETSEGGVLSLGLDTPGGGSYCLVVFVEDSPTAKAPTITTLTAVASIDHADLSWALPSGWAYPIVPRNDATATSTSVPLPATLVGDASATYFNFAATNTSVSDATASSGVVLVDGDSLFAVGLPLLPPGTTAKVLNAGPHTVRGGRHTIGMEVDDSLRPDLATEDNAYGLQYAFDAGSTWPGILNGLVRSRPPGIMAGWESVDRSTLLRFNCDGLVLSPGSAAWSAVAVTPSPGNDVDVKLYGPGADVTDRFARALAFSGWGTNQTDFVLVHESAGSGPYDIGVLDGAASAGQYAAHAATSTDHGTEPAGAFGPYTLPAGRLISLHAFEITASRTVRVDVQNEAGTVNWGLSIHGTDYPFGSRSTAIPHSMAWLAAAGEGEFVYAYLEPGSYCAAVWKANTAGVPQSGSFSIVFDSPVGVDTGGVLTENRLAPLQNPFRGRARFALDLIQPTAVVFEVYDLRGRRLYTTEFEGLAAGPHELSWPGTDAAGRDAAAGVYFARVVGTRGVLASARVVKL